MKPRLFSKLKILLAVFIWIVFWALLSLAVANPLLLPGPLAVFKRLGELIRGADFWRCTLTSLLRVLLGVVSAAVLASLLAALSERSSPAKALIGPVMTVIKSTPVASFTILVLLWLSRDAAPVLICALIVMPVVFSNVSAGIRSVDPLLLELAQAYRLGRMKTFRRIKLPSVMPYFRSAMQSSLGFGWKAGVAAEVLTLPRQSIGRMIMESKLYLETGDLFAWTLAVILLSLLIERLLMRLISGRRQENG